MASDAEALVRALGELVVSLRRRHRTRRHNTEKRAILRWLRSLKWDEMASLCCVEDVSFVKTLLQMAAHSRRSAWRVQEFQLLPQTVVYGSNHKRTALQTAPREFVKRPVIRTADGDVIDGFHTREYHTLCLKVLESMRVLNTLQSCDTVALSMDFCQPLDAFFHVMDVISCGEFLIDSPSDTTLKCRTWGETKWLQNQGFYSLQALFLNQIELNIWFYWKQHQKDAAATIPRRGLVAKLYLVHEWEQASVNQQNAVLRKLSSKIISHLRDLKPFLPLQAAKTAQFQAARISLDALTSLLTGYQSSKQQQRKQPKSSVDVCFTCAFQDAVTSPQAAVLKLLLAEHLQEQCSLLLCERLSRDEEETSPARVRLRLEADGRDGCLVNRKKSANHSQRRRASRKKLLKLRRKQGAMRAAQQTRLTCVLRELMDVFRQKQAATLADVGDVLYDIIDRAIDEDQLISGGWSCLSPPCHAMKKEPVQPRRKKKKKKAKLKTDVRVDAAETTAAEREERPCNSQGDQLSSLWHRPAVSTSRKPLSCQVRDDCQAGARSAAATIDSDSLPCQQEELLVDARPDNKENDPSFNYFATLGSTRPSSTFSSHPFYSTSSSTPLSSLLAAPTSSSQASRRALDDDSSHQTGKYEASVASDPSTFEWYMPSVFSFQASTQRTPAPPSTLDWHFNQWHYKAPDTSSLSDKHVVCSTSRDVEADPVPPPSPSPSSSSSPCSISSCFPTTKTPKKKEYSLASFSKIAGMDSSRRQTAPLIRATSDDGSMSVDSEHESDFLYREGGFFDRQRTLKRRRRPWPFHSIAAEDDKQDMVEEQDATIERFKPLQGETWAEGLDCCKCACHHHHAFSLGIKRSDGVDDGKTGGEKALVGKMTSALERIAMLEEKLGDHTKTLNEQLATALAEIPTLQQTIATLTAQLHNVENNIQELQHQHATSAASLGNDASSCDSPRNSFSPAPSSRTQQPQQPPESSSPAARPFLATYAPSNSVMGPFVSVPLSVLPPRSKLHWDLCEFAAQLQADSDARLPAQVAAQRLCMATVQSLWPRAQVRPYGSHVTRLVLPSSDVDLVICLPKVRRDAPADAAGMLEGRNAIKETWQQNLARKLKQEPWVVRDSVKTLPHAAVPIITLLTAPPYNVRLDISFEGPGHNGLATNDVVLALLHEFPPLAPMMLILKSFAIERGLAVAYSGGLSSYALLLLVVRYLQEHSDTMPNGFANASRAVHHSLSTVQAGGGADFGLMLMGFLDFYGNRFDPRTTGISVASRCFLNRESTFLTASGLPEPHQVPSPPYHHHHHHHHQYAVDDAAVNDRTSQYGSHHPYWQAPGPPHLPPFVPTSDATVPPQHGFRRCGYRSSLDLPASRGLDGGTGAATGLLDYQQLQQQTYDPHKFDPVFIEDPLCPSNNVGRNCFRIMQIRRAFSAAHVALRAAARDPTVLANNRMDLVAGVALHPDNLLRAILGANAPVNAKPEAVTSGPTSIEPQYTFYVANPHPQPLYQPHQHFYYSSPQLQPPLQQPLDPASRRHSESEGETFPTRSSMSTASRLRKKHMGSPQLPLQTSYSDKSCKGLLRQVSTDSSRQARRLGNRQAMPTDQQLAKGLSRKTSERSMSLSLSFADVVREGGGTKGGNPTTVHKTRAGLSSARPPRFSRDDMALGESINERWEIKDDSELK